MRRAGVILALLSAWFAACRALPEIPEGTCGNHVIEEGEDCDGFARAGQSCRAPGGVGQCHLDCSGPTSGVDACPEGFGCDSAGVCRRPSGRFAEEPAGAIVGSAVRLTGGDFDGDGRADVVSRGAAGFFGLARLGIHYFDRSAALAESWTTTQLFGSTAVVGLNDDSRSDLLVLQFAICAMLGESNRSITPRAYPSYLLQGTQVKVTPLLDRRVENSSALAVLRQVDNTFHLERPSSNQSERLVPVASFDAGDDGDALPGEPAAAHLFTDRELSPCEELAIAFRRTGEVTLYQLCEVGEKGVRWKQDATVTHLEFEPPAEPSSGPMFADLDGNGHDDLLIATDAIRFGHAAYVAFNDGEKLGKLAPLTIRVDDEDEPVLMSPIAAGDISGDGRADLILPRVVLIGLRGDGDELVYRGGHEARRGLWSQALIADLNGDEKPDAIMASSGSPDIEYFQGTGTDRQNPFVIATPRPVEWMTVGDFDGDSISDLGFVSHGETVTEDDIVSIAYGNAAGIPDASVAVVHTPGVTSLVPLMDNDNDATADLLVLSDLVGDVVGPADDPAGTSQPSQGTPNPLERTSSLSILIGSADRLFFSPILLTNFSTDGTFDEAEGVAGIAGHFSHPQAIDLLAIGARDPEPDDGILEIIFSLWSLADFSSGRSVPHTLDWNFDERLSPLLLDDPLSAPLAVRLAAADLDGDSLDELVLAAPTGNRAPCLVTWAKLEDGAKRLGPVQTLVFDDTCDYEPPLEIRDIDGDGAADLAILLGVGGDAFVQVLWNDGYGGFAPENSSQLRNSEGVRAFTLLRPFENGPLKFAYVTPGAVHWGEVRGSSRSFDTPQTLEGFDVLTGIAAGDFNGDGVTDLAVADAGTVRILKAGLDNR